jgi:hypothetical protein
MHVQYNIFVAMQARQDFLLGTINTSQTHATLNHIIARADGDQIHLAKVADSLDRQGHNPVLPTGNDDIHKTSSQQWAIMLDSKLECDCV